MKFAAIRFGLLLLPLSVVGCNTVGSGTNTSTATVSAIGTVVAQTDMPAFCQNAAANRYNAPLDNISTQSPQTRSFGLLFEGTVTTDTNTLSFDCRFSSTGAFLGLIAQ